jgi:hypothetical protein
MNSGERGEQFVQVTASKLEAKCPVACFLYARVVKAKALMAWFLQDSALRDETPFLTCPSSGVFNATEGKKEKKLPSLFKGATLVPGTVNLTHQSKDSLCISV